VEATSTPAPYTRTAGSLILDVQPTVDGGVALNATVKSSGARIAELCYSTGDAAALDRRVDYIAARADAGMLPEDIANEIAALSAAAEVVNTATVEPVAPKANPLASLAATSAPHRRQIRTTKAAPAPTSEAQHRILRAAADNPHGIVNRSKDATIKQLLAMAGKGDGDGLVRLIRDNTRRGYISGAVITDAGRRELARLDGLAAEQARRAQILAGAR
jgi:hypothetical protein